MAATKIGQYNAALRLLADARLDLITDDAESRRALDDAWDSATKFVLRLAPWQFAVKTVTLATTVGVAPGYATAYAYPANWLRTHAIYLVDTSGRESPFDLKELNGVIQVNMTTAPTMRYVDARYADPAFADWPEHFAQTHAAYLAFSVAERVTGDKSAASRVSDLFSSLLPEAVKHDAVPESRWLLHQRNGGLLRGALMLLRQGFWRFALKTVTPASGGTPAVGYSNSFTQPSDWLRTHALFVAAVGREFPFDVREHAGQWSANVSAFSARYVSSTLGLNSTLWQDGFMKALLAYLEADDAGEKEGGAYPALLAAALEAESEPPNKWLSAQLDGTFLRASRTVLGAGYWVFRGADGVMYGLKERLYNAGDDQLTADPAQGFPYRYPLPSDWFRTHALFVPWDGKECPINIRQSASDWSTDASSFVARYVSTDVLDAQRWPEIVADAVFACIQWTRAPDEAAKVRQSEYDRLLAEALALHSRPEDDWLRFQLDGRFRPGVEAVLERARWRFAVKTVSLTESSDPIPAVDADGTLSSGYTYRFIKPNDVLRTSYIHYAVGTGVDLHRYDIDYRDEQEAIHANYTPLIMRYISRLGLNSTAWPANFREAVLAWLQYQEARADPRRLGQAKALLDIFEDRVRRAEMLDDARERPLIRSTGRVVQARWGRTVPWDIYRPGTATGGGITVLTDDDETVVLTP